mmetsp:Transcript_93254/g.161642  ORF Transcript_93254/g.161642 Transcript_93254/m.161642 type:complete len:391 (-) Transcript_93254:213-1385(-)
MGFAHFLGGVVACLTVVFCVMPFQGQGQDTVPTFTMSSPNPAPAPAAADHKEAPPIPAPQRARRSPSRVQSSVLYTPRAAGGPMPIEGLDIPVLRGAERLKIMGSEKEFEQELPQKSIAVILTQYLRPHLRSQLELLQKQTLRPTQIYVVQNAPEPNVQKMIAAGKWHVPDVEAILKDFPEVMHVDYRNFNSKFFGRFALALSLATDYVMIMDDDVSPGPKYLEKTLELSLKYNAIVCETGRLFQPGSEGNFSIGIVTAPIDQPVQVDFGGHIWFFKREWAHYMWALQPVTMLTCEDAHLSIAAMVLGNISTYVPPQPERDKALWGTTIKKRGDDIVAQSKNRIRYPAHTRTKILQYWVQKGWKPIITKGVTTPYKVWWLDQEMKDTLGY